MMIPAAIAMALVCFSFKPADKKPWDAPGKDAQQANPVKSSPASIDAGKEVWAKKCASCHGKTGLGDGTKASELKTDPGDFSTAAFQKQSDGSLFYKTAKGRDDMPSFEKKIPDANDIWNVVNYMRTLKK